MAIPGITTTFQDGGLGSSTFIADRVHAKVGVAEDGPMEPKLIVNFEQGRNLYKSGPLVESLRWHFQEFNEALGQTAQPVIAVRADGDTAGSVTATPDPGITGTPASEVVGGTPTTTRTVVLLITTAGAHGVAEYRLSIDGGANFGAPLLTPATGQPISLGSGVTITFTDNAGTPADTFHAGDRRVYEIVGPTASNAARIEGAEKLVQDYRPRWIQLLGPGSRAFATSVKQMLVDFDAAHNEMFAVTEGPAKPDGMSVADYNQLLVDEYAGFESVNVVVCSAECRYIPGGIAAFGGYSSVRDAGDTVGEWRNCATLLSAKLAAGPVNESAGYVQNHRSLAASEIRYWATGYQDMMDVLHDLGHTVLMQYADNDGIYIAKDRILAAPDSDFKEIPERRRADKVNRLTYKALLPRLNGDTNPASGAVSFQHLANEVRSVVAASMMRGGSAEISGVEIVLDPNGTFKTTGELEAQMGIAIANRIGMIRWTNTFTRAASN